MVQAGVDEAGRGPVIGPMVIACVVLNSNSVKLLKRVAKDSKKLSPRSREKVYRTILEVANEVKIRVVEPLEIDAAVAVRGLNRLEARVTAELLGQLTSNIDLVFVDSPDPQPDRYAALVKGFLTRHEINIIAANHAELLYPHVAAASIVAKVERDNLVTKLKDTYGDFGSGYPSDPKTIAFLRKFMESGVKYPPIVRRSWRTLLKMNKII
ncbi:MAG: ribonuclease HII [Thermofilaceae archaeon]